MPLKKAFPFAALLLFISITAFTQSDRIRLGDKQYQLLDRLDIKLQNDSILSFSTIKPYNRRIYTERVEYLDSLYQADALPAELSSVDRQNIGSMLMNNAEWTKPFGDSFRV
ncbi:MAG TPA: hypothetical protein VFV68_09705, partial [Agriterribacter sp.]|nr:hypothetical protein [Agriterribacter sp.]